MSRLSDREGKGVFPVLYDLLLSVLTGLGLSYYLSDAVFGSVPVSECTAACLCGVVFFVCCRGAGKRLRAGLLAAALAGLAVSRFFNAGPLFDMEQAVRASILTVQGNANALLPFQNVFARILSLILGILCSAAALSPESGLLLTVTVLFSGFVITPVRDSMLLYASSALAGTVMLTARRREKRRWSAVPAAAVILTLSLLLTPSGDITLSPFSDAARWLRETVEDHFGFSGERERFSLTSAGYMMLGDRLGGRAIPDGERQVLRVETDRKLYLRAVAADLYNGFNWYDTQSTHRYLYTSLNERPLRQRIFDSLIPYAGGEGAVSARVTVLDRESTTLYVPQRLRSLTTEADRMVVYWNEGSEVFIPRSLMSGDSYSFSYLPFSAEDEGTEALIGAASGQPDERLGQLEEVYLAIPSHLQREVYDMAEEAAGNAANPYHRALNIAAWLKSRYPYSLDVSDPPANSDFCAWFLLREKKGYCTYFATAMTLLCRIAGVPARYVTGYMAVPENGIAIVTGADAHAWTEIYLNGFGWLTVDATPGSDAPDGQDRREEPPSTPPRTPSPAPSPVPAPETAQDTPSPEPVMTPSPAPENGEDEPPAPPSATATPPPTGEGRQEEESDGGGQGLFPLLLPLLLLLALLLALLVLRVYFRDPRRMERRYPERAAGIWLAAIRDALVCLNRIRRSDETLTAFAERMLGDEGFSGVPFAEAARQAEAYLYGRRVPDPTLLRRTYDGILAGMRPGKRFLFRLYRARLRRRKNGRIAQVR